jgi:valyl-tRNA synthetase
VDCNLSNNKGKKKIMETKNHKKSFTIIMPPANANGNLHAGHALVMTLEDIITRYKRMQGFKTLWLPGLDHAGFETQVVYEKKLEKEGRFKFGMDLIYFLTLYTFIAPIWLARAVLKAVSGSKTSWR